MRESIREGSQTPLRSALTGLVSWQVVYTKQAQKDAEKLAAAGLQLMPYSS